MKLFGINAQKILKHPYSKPITVEMLTHAMEPIESEKKELPEEDCDICNKPLSLCQSEIPLKEEIARLQKALEKKEERCTECNGCNGMKKISDELGTNIIDCYQCNGTGKEPRKEVYHCKESCKQHPRNKDTEAKLSRYKEALEKILALKVDSYPGLIYQTNIALLYDDVKHIARTALEEKCQQCGMEGCMCKEGEEIL